MAPMPDPSPPRESSAGGAAESAGAAPDGTPQTPRPNWRDRPVRDLPKKPLEAWLGEFEQRVRESDAERAREEQERAFQRAAGHGPQRSAEPGPHRRGRRRRRGDAAPRAELPPLEGTGMPARRRRRGRGRGRSGAQAGGASADGSPPPSTIPPQRPPSGTSGPGPQGGRRGRRHRRRRRGPPPSAP